MLSRGCRGLSQGRKPRTQFQENITLSVRAGRLCERLYSFYWRTGGRAHYMAVTGCDFQIHSCLVRHPNPRGGFGFEGFLFSHVLVGCFVPLALPKWRVIHCQIGARIYAIWTGNYSAQNGLNKPCPNPRLWAFGLIHWHCRGRCLTMRPTYFYNVKIYDFGQRESICCKAVRMNKRICQWQIG